MSTAEPFVDEMPGTTAIVPSCSVDAILAERDACVRWAQQVQALIDGAPRGALTIFADGHRRQRERWDLAAIARDFDRSGWRRVMGESGLYSFLDAVARAEWEKHLEDGTFPPLTADNIEATMAQVHADRPRMVARGVLDLFRALSGNYKTNKPQQFTRRMILTHVLEVWGSGAERHRFRHPHHRSMDRLDDLTRFLTKMRGAVEPDHRRGAYHTLGDALKQDTSLAPWEVEFDFFTVRLFLNGNGHLMFKHDEDVARLNRALAFSDRNGLANDKR